MSRILPAETSGVLQSAFRMVVGFLFACHGAASLFGILVQPRGPHGGVVHLGQWPSWWAAVIQFVGGMLVAVGLGTRVAAFICSGSMAYAYFVVHQPQGALPIQNSGELAALYSWLFLLIVVLGPGPLSLDSLWHRYHAHPTAVAPPASHHEHPRSRHQPSPT